MHVPLLILAISHLAAFVWGRSVGKEYIRRKIKGAYYFLHPPKE